MPLIVRSLSLCFAAGALGGLANSAALYFFGSSGINDALGVAIAPAFTPAWLYPRLVWGGIWGMLFLLPLSGMSWFTKGFFFSIGPTLVQLFYIFPVRADKGMMGLELGSFTPLVVILMNAIWGWVAAIWLRLDHQPKPKRGGLLD